SALRHFNDQRILATFTDIEFAQPRTKPPGLGPDDRIVFGVVIGAASEDLNGNYGFFQLMIPALQMPLDHELQKPGETVITSETGAPEDSLQFLPHSPSVRFDG